MNKELLNVVTAAWRTEIGNDGRGEKLTAQSLSKVVKMNKDDKRLPDLLFQRSA